MTYTLNLKFYSYLFEIVEDYEKNLIHLFGDIITTRIDTQSSCLYLNISQELSKQKLQEFLSYLLYITHPFYSITNDLNREVFQADFSTREYFLYYDEQRRQELFQIQYLIFKTRAHFIEEFRQEKKISFVDIYSVNTTLSIECSKIFQKIPLNVMKRFNVEYSSQQSSLSLPYPNSALFKNNNLKGENKIQDLEVKQFHVLTHHQELLKQIKEETSKAHIKIRPSIIENELLDVKFVANHFTFVFSSLITPIYLEHMREIMDNFNFNASEEDFTQFIDYFLYQAEFITSYGISLLCEYEIQPSVLKKYNLKSLEKIQIPHPFDSSKNCFLYIIKKVRKS